ncbi:MAG: T9SS type A sorting domain-containing protein [Crocinitomicaceae bacterium]|nr:T9SS type A sorting domain-containing protein [Crocinitomicaceae bacterium]
MKRKIYKFILAGSFAFAIKSGSAQCTTAQTFNYTGALQTFVVPAGVTTITAECYGAKGGNGNQPSSTGGNGAYIKGDISVTPGETLNIISGGAGVSGVTSLEGGGGGGGSFVIRATGNVPLIIAGGGGGGSYQASTPGTGGSSTTTGNAGGYVPTLPGQGGFSDNGGGGGTGGGGGGWNANGSSNTWANGGTMQGGAGGIPNFGYIGAGGFGGGGSAFHGGGGGGGYSGGGGGIYTIGGGGAGSYNTGTNQTNSADVNSGNGYVVLTYASVYNMTVSETICFGSDYTFPDGSTQTGITSQVVQTSTLTAVVGGCDSIIETTVDVFPSIDNGVSLAGLTITADATSGTYQWLLSSDNCVSFTAIGGETNQSFTATADGDYAVIISDNGCSDTSVCTNITYFGLNENDAHSFSLFPNPADDAVTVYLSQASGVNRVEVLSITGSLVASVNISSAQVNIGLENLNPGVYFVRIKSEDGKISDTQKLIIR